MGEALGVPRPVSVSARTTRLPSRIRELEITLGRDWALSIPLFPLATGGHATESLAISIGSVNSRKLAAFCLREFA
jgi:hypothetical protein